MTTNEKTIQSSYSVSSKLYAVYRDSTLIRGVLLFFAWLAVWQAGRLVEYTAHASVWFPVAGFTFACMLVIGRRAFVPIMLAAIVITVWNIKHYQIPLNLAESIWGGLLFGLAHIMPYWIGALVIEKLSKQAGHNAPQLIVAFLLVAGISALIVTVLVIWSLVMTNQMPAADVSITLLPFWVGDMAGVVVLTPLFSGALIRLSPKPKISLNQFTEPKIGSYYRLCYKVSINVILIVVSMLLAYLSQTEESSFAIFFLAVTHMWIACTESPKFNVISLAISSILIILLVHRLGLMDFVMVYQFAINVIAANALFGIAVPQLKAHNLQLEHKVFTDSLTQVSSREYLIQRAKLEIIQSHELNHPLSLVVFDLDDFKLINDQYGHTAGDMALQSVCEQAKKNLRRADIIARFGGDEFVLLFPELDQQGTSEVVERIRSAVSKIKISDSLLSSSFGIAELLPDEAFSALFHRADDALYKAKKSGGNQISVAQTD